MRSITNSRALRLAAALTAALAIAACSKTPDPNAAGGLGAGGAGAAVPGSQQDFVVNVGDRVFFETDSTDLTSQAQATLDKQSRWLAQYPRYTITMEGHADERGTREYNFALGSKRAEVAKNYLVARGVPRVAHPHDQLRQGASGRGLQRHLLLVAEPPRGHRARRLALSGTAET